MYLERFIPSVAEIRTVLFNFYHEKYEQLLYHKLIDACVKEHMKISINTTEVNLIEKRQGSSLNQGNRTGVITTSNGYHTDIACVI